MELGDKKEYSLSHTHTHTQTRIMMHSDWRYSIQYCMPRTDALFNKLPISKVKYEVYKYLKNPVNTMITSAINESKRKISAEKEKCPPLCASASYKRFVAGIHEEREKNEKPEWRYIDKPILEKIHQHVNSYDSHYVNPALASDWMKIFNSSEDTTYAFTYREFTWLILQMCFMTAEKVDELWNSATPVPKRDPVHEIYWKLTIFEEIQKWSHRVAFREAIFEQEGHVNRQQGRINRVERGGRGYTYKYLKLNNMELAKEYFEKSSELNPNDPQIVYNLANLEYRDKSYQKAFDLYHKALNNNLSSPLVLVQMGRCLMGLGSLEDAAILFDNALESDPKCEQAYIEHAEIMALKNDPEATIDYFYKALDINPDSPLALQRLARYFNKINKPKMALNFAQKAMNLGIADKDTFYEQALVLYKIGYPEEAIFSLKKILEVDSKDSEAFNLIGKCLIKLKMFDEAVESFCDAIYFKSDIQEYYTNLGLSLSELGRFKDAQECLTKAISLSEGSSNANYLLGKIFGV